MVDTECIHKLLRSRFLCRFPDGTLSFGRVLNSNTLFSCVSGSHASRGGRLVTINERGAANAVPQGNVRNADHKPTPPGLHAIAGLSLSSASRHLLTCEEDHQGGVPSGLASFRIDFGGYTVALRHLRGLLTFTTVYYVFTIPLCRRERAAGQLCL